MTDRDIMQQALDALEIAEVDGNCCYEATELLRTLLTQPAPQPDAYGYASRLAVAIWEQHYKDVAPQWKPLDDLMGVLTQIDNMTTGLMRKPISTPRQMQPCAGRNCGSTNPNLHSAECFEDYEKSTGMAQPEQPNDFHPDWDAMAVMVEEQQRMAKRIEELEAQPEQEPVVDERIKSVRHMRDVQGYDGNWNYDPYMQGLYNGLEFALSLLEVRQPEFKDAPATWLGDIKFKRDKLSSGAAHGIKEKNA